jgi:hypothetical protein
MSSDVVFLTLLLLLLLLLHENSGKPRPLLIFARVG